jgi:hypothetical protein
LRYDRHNFLRRFVRFTRQTARIINDIVLQKIARSDRTDSIRSIRVRRINITINYPRRDLISGARLTRKSTPLRYYSC